MFTKTDGTTVTRIGRVIEARIIDNDGAGTAGFFVEATTYLNRYQGPVYDTLGDAAKKTPCLPLAVRQALYAVQEYPANAPSVPEALVPAEYRQDQCEHGVLISADCTECEPRLA